MENVRTKIAVYGFILREDNTFLLIQRAEHDSMPGIWELPGGALEKEEDPDKGVIREVKEETSLFVEVVRPVTISSSYAQSNQPDQLQHTLRISFVCKLLSSFEELQLSPDHASFQWTSLAQFPVESISDFTALTIEDAQKQKIL